MFVLRLNLTIVMLGVDFQGFKVLCCLSVICLRCI